MKCSNFVKGKKVLSVLLSIVMLIVPVLGGSLTVGTNAKAAGADTADLRFLFTSDLHGQITTVDYETGGSYNAGSLAKAATLIKKARNEAGAENTMLFDGGDNMYDYTTDYIYNYDDTAIQPHFKAMASLNYDALTMGNHDFEYTLPYIQNQLTATGLADKVVLSNVKYANTGESVWAETKIIEKTLTTQQNKQMSVKVGVIGETIPTLSKKRGNYTGVLVTEDIVENARKQAASLKAQGADVVVVIAHSGIGTENPENMATDVGYALTKISDVDVVLCGHRHGFFSANGTTKYDSMTGVDTENGLVNGKNLLMVKNRGAGIGVVDLTLSTESGSVQVVERATAIRKSTVNTAADADINTNYMGEWGNIFMSDRSAILSELDSSAKLHNFFGTTEDSGAIQLLNNIRISYGLNYINNVDTNYQNLPVIAASKYLKYGEEDGDDYVNITGQFTRANMYDLIDYRTAIYVFKVTGSQIKEWLEWTASAYETGGSNVLVTPEPSPTEPEPSPTELATGGGITTGSAASGSSLVQTLSQKMEILAKGVSDKININDVLSGILNNYKGNEPLQYSLQEDWISDWSNYYIFDGLEYSINTKEKPRYSLDGAKINESRRLTSVTRNGVAIKDEEEFVLVSTRLPTVPLLEGIAAQELYHCGTDACRSYIQSYVNKVSLTGTMKNRQDNNWSVKYNDDYQYLVKTSENAASIASSKEWIGELLNSESGFYYYRADFRKMKNYDYTGPSVNAVALNEEETNNDVKVVVQTTDVSGVASVKYILGKYLKNSGVWNLATNMTDQYFTCNENGIYSILTEDNLGNKTVSYIRIDNINKSALEAPKVNTYTNRMKYISGTAEPNSKINFELQSGKVYSDTVNSKGAFKYALTPQKSGDKVYVYVTDDKGRASSRTVVTVKRTGPNKPSMSDVLTKTKTISGNLNDTYVYPVVIVDNKTVYVPNDGTKALYNSSELYKSKYKVVEVNMNITSKGNFSFQMNSLQSKGTVVDVRTLDAIARSSMLTRKKVKQTVPAKPSASQITNKSKNIKIYSEEKCLSASAKIGKKTYTSSKAKYLSSKKQYRYTVKIPRSDTGAGVKIYVTNVKGKSARLSMTKKEVVPDTPKLNKMKVNAKKITGKVHLVGSSNEKQTVSNTKTKVFVFINNKKYKAKVKANGTFQVKVPRLRLGSRIVCQAQNLKGKSLKRVKKVK